LIDSLNNELVLSLLYELMYKVKNSETGALWTRLSKEDQEELVLADMERNNPANLISNSETQKSMKNG